MDSKSLCELPADGIREIFSFLDARSLFNIGLLSKQCYAIANAMPRWIIGSLQRNIIRGHAGSVTCVESVDDKIFSCSTDRSIRVWDNAGNLENRVYSHFRKVCTILVTEYIIFSGSQDCQVHAFHTTFGMQCLGKFEGHSSSVTALVVKNIKVDTKTCIIWLFSGSEDCTVRTWKFRLHRVGLTELVESYRLNSEVIQYDTTNQEGRGCRTLLELEACCEFTWNNPIFCLCLDEQRDLLFVASADILVCSVADTQNHVEQGSKSVNIVPVEIISPGQSITCMALLTFPHSCINSQNISLNTWLIASCTNHTIHVWDACRFSCLQVFSGHTATISSLGAITVSTSNFVLSTMEHFDNQTVSLIVSGSLDRTIRIWSMNGACERIISCHSPILCLSVSFCMLPLTQDFDSDPSLHHNFFGGFHVSLFLPSLIESVPLFQ